jgi:adenosylcobinamide-GDP ribazoletransferase
MGRSFKNAVRWSHVLIAGLIAALVAWAVSGPGGLTVAAGSSLLALVVARWMAGRLDGLTGDAYGAICELTETGVLVALGLRMGSIGG